MPPSPIIGVATGRIPTQTPLPFVGTNEAYLRSIRRAGGLPLLIPVGYQRSELAAVLQHQDGQLLTGGGDIDPRLTRASMTSTKPATSRRSNWSKWQ
jgi:putative glutamine amidotransferase